MGGVLDGITGKNAPAFYRLTLEEARVELL